MIAGKDCQSNRVCDGSATSGKPSQGRLDRSYHGVSTWFSTLGAPDRQFARADPTLDLKEGATSSHALTLTRAPNSRPTRLPLATLPPCNTVKQSLRQRPPKPDSPRAQESTQQARRQSHATQNAHQKHGLYFGHHPHHAAAPPFDTPWSPRTSERYPPPGESSSLTSLSTRTSRSPSSTAPFDKIRVCSTEPFRGERDGKSDCSW